MRGILNSDSCRRRSAIVAVLAVLACDAGSAAAAQLQQGTVEGALLAPDGTAVATAIVTLLDSLGEPVLSTRAESGRFRLSNVPPGTYSLRAEALPLRAVVETLIVRDAVPIRVDLRLSAVAAEQVLVRGDAEESGSPTAGITLAGETIRRAPVRLRSRALQSAIATAPGWATEDNGLLHVRGVDDGFLYVVDGVPVYERLDGLFGMAPDAAMIDSVNVLTGHVPAEFGWKAGGVIEVRSASRRSEGWTGTIDAAAGNESSREFSAVGGGAVGSRTALTLGAAGQASSRFLDPVHPDNLHNDGQALNGGAQLAWMLSPGSVVTLVAGAGRSAFAVPHDEEQEEAGQDQRQRLGNLSQTGSWQRAWNSQTVSQVAGYYRHSFSTLRPGLLDTPLRTDAHRTLQRAGVLASITHQRGRHLFKLGGEAARLTLDEEFSFVIVDDEEAEESELSEEALGHTADDPFVFEDRAQPVLYSVYVQDSIQATRGLTVDVGVRADWSRMLVAASQVSPRLGASYQWPSTGTTLRGSFARFFQPPQPENLLLASSPQARALSPFVNETDGGGADLVPETQTALDVSISQMLAHRLRVEVAAWRRRVSNAADPNVFFGTTLIVPNVVDRGRASGVDVRVEVPRREGWSGYVSYANSRVVQFGPITGGLFLEDEVIEIGPGTKFTPDHDQRHVSSFGLSYDHEEAGTSVSVSGRYESGTPLEVEEDELDELRERPGAELVDFENGRVRPRSPIDLSIVQRIARAARMDAELRVSLLNVTGDRWAYNFGNPFSGTHFGPGRTLHVGVRLMVR